MASAKKTKTKKTKTKTKTKKPKPKKKTKAERSKELSKIKKLLRKDEYREQAVELLVALDDPQHWSAVSATIEIPIDQQGFAQVGNANMHLLSHMNDALDGVDEKKRLAAQLRLQAGSVLIAAAVPHAHRIIVQGRSAVPWPSLDEVAKLQGLRTLDLLYFSLGNGDALEAFTQVTKLLLARNDITRIPGLPNIEELALQQLGSPSIGPMPKLRAIHIATSPQLVDWSGIGASSVLERVEVVGDSHVVHLDPIGEAIARGAPVREVLLPKCPSLESIRGLEGAKHLERLIVRSAPKLEDLSALASATALRTLELSECGVGDVSVLKSLKRLEVLDLSGCSNATGIKALKDHPCLRVVALGGTVFTREELGDLLPWATWARSPHIPSLEARARFFIN